MTLPDSVVHNSPIQVRPVVVLQESSIDSLQQQVCTFWSKVQEVRVFLQREARLPPPADHLYRSPPWGLSVHVPFLFIPLIFLRLRLCSNL